MPTRNSAEMGSAAPAGGPGGPPRRRALVGIASGIVAATPIGLVALWFVDAARRCAAWHPVGDERIRCLASHQPAPFAIAASVALAVVGVVGLLVTARTIERRGGRRAGLFVSAPFVAVGVDVLLSLGLEWHVLAEGAYAVVLVPTNVLIGVLTVWWVADSTITAERSGALAWTSVMGTGGLASLGSWALVDAPAVLWWFAPLVVVSCAVGLVLDAVSNGRSHRRYAWVAVTWMVPVLGAILFVGGLA